MQRLEKELGKTIVESRPFYEMKDHMNYALVENEKVITKLRNTISLAKDQYVTATENLRIISQQIHEKRLLLSASKKGPPTSLKSAIPVVTVEEYDEQLLYQTQQPLSM